MDFVFSLKSPTGTLRALGIGTALAVALFAGAAESYAETKMLRTSKHVAVFWLCEEWCVPIVYSWDAWMRTDFTRSRWGLITLDRHEQTVSMDGARNGPCNVSLGIDTEVYQDRGSWYLGSLRVETLGSYWVPASNIHWGGSSYPHWSVYNPRLRLRPVATPWNCWGWSTFSWDVEIP